MKGATCIVLLAVCVAMSAAIDSYCTSNKDCPTGSCCAMGMQRYSYPSCRPLSVVGEPCRPTGPLRSNATLYYPDNTEITLDNVYVQMCPCEDGLSCNRATSECSA